VFTVAFGNYEHILATSVSVACRVPIFLIHHVRGVLEKSYKISMHHNVVPVFYGNV